MDLKPCPFCGGTSIRRLRLHYDCLDCGGRNNFANWNTRPLEDALKAKLASCQEADAVEYRDGVIANLQGMIEAGLAREAGLKAKLDVAARLAESTRECVGEVVDGSEAARLRDKLAKVQAWRDEMLPDCCSCSDRYSKRSLIDPSCHWHDLDVPDLDAILNDAREGGEES